MNRIAMPGVAAIIAVLSELLEIGLVVLNGAGDIEFATPRGRELLGCSGNLELSYCYPEARTAVQEVLALATADPTAVARRQTQFIADDKPHDLSIEAHPLNGTNCEGYALLIRDDAGVRKMAADLKLSAELRHMRRLCQSVMHDLKQPISAMLVHLELLKGSIAADEGTEGDGALRSWGIIRSQATELNRILTLLLEEISPSETEERGFSLRSVLQDVARLVEPEAARQNVQVELHLADHAARLNGSRQLVKQSVLSVALNGLDAMPGGGILRMELDVHGEEARLRISDTGTGVDHPADIFEVHYGTMSTGMGAGLFLAREVVRRHGGEIGVDRHAGEGMRVEIRLPVGESPS